MPEPRRCVAHSKRSGAPCRKAPEPGQTVCRMHGAHRAVGGNGNLGVRNGEWQDGKYSKVFAGTPMAERYRQLVEDPEYASLKGEIATMMIAYEAYFEAHKDQMDDAPTAKTAALLSDQLRRLRETAHRIEYDESHLINEATLMTYAARIASIVRGYLPDPQAQQSCLWEIQALFYGRTRALPIAGEVIDG